MPICWLMIRDVVLRFCRADLTICLTSQALLMGGLWYPACRSVWPSEAHERHTRMTVWMDVNQSEGRYNGTIIHTLDRQRSCLYRIPPLLTGISCYCSRYNTIFWANSDLKKCFLKEKPITQLFFYAELQISFLHSAWSKCAKILIICRFQPHLLFMRF